MISDFIHNNGDWLSYCVMIQGALALLTLFIKR